MRTYVIKSPIFSLNYHDYLIIFLCNFHEISWFLYVRMSQIHMSHDILIWYSHEINISIYVISHLISHDFFHDLSWDFSVRAYLKQNQTTRHTQLGQKVLQHQLFVLWEDYDRDKTDTYRLLQKLTRLYTKTIQNFDDDV